VPLTITEPLFHWY